MIVAGGPGAILSALAPGDSAGVLLQLAGLGTSVTTTVARVITAIPGAAIQIGSWPARLVDRGGGGGCRGVRVVMTLATRAAKPLRP